MPLRLITIEIPSQELLSEELPESFLKGIESAEVLHVYSFQPREAMILLRIVPKEPHDGESPEKGGHAEIMGCRWGCRLRSFELLRTEMGGRECIGVIRLKTSRSTRALLERIGPGVTLTTPTVIGEETTTMSFVADDDAEGKIFEALKRLRIEWRLVRHRNIDAARLRKDTIFTARQREVLTLAWNLGYFDIPAKVGLDRIASLTGMSRNTVSQHLRRGTRHALKDLL